MPAERQRWIDTTTWGDANAQLRRRCDVFDAGMRVHPLAYDATATVAITFPRVLVKSDTTAGAVALTLPDAAAHVGFEVKVKKTAGANALTVNGTSVTTFGTWVSDGAAWQQVG